MLDVQVRALPLRSELAWATWDNRKTQTRRVASFEFLEGRSRTFSQYTPCHNGGGLWTLEGGLGSATKRLRCPYGKPGDLLYVKEDHYRYGTWLEVPCKRTVTGLPKLQFTPQSKACQFTPPAEFRPGLRRADHATPAYYKRLGRFMPRAISRMTLRITEIRVERIQDISDPDAFCEGIEMETDTAIGGCFYGGCPELFDDPVQAVRHLWNSINEARGFGWDKNPWVWVICFEVIRANVDDVLAGRVAA